MDEDTKKVETPEKVLSSDEMKEIEDNASMDDVDRSLDIEGMKSLLLRQNETIKELKNKYAALKEQNAELALRTNFGDNSNDPDELFRKICGIQ